MSFEDQLGRLASLIRDVEADTTHRFQELEEGALRHREQVLNSLQDIQDRLFKLEREIKLLSVPKPISEEHQRIRDAIMNLKHEDYEHDKESDNG